MKVFITTMITVADFFYVGKKIYVEAGWAESQEEALFLALEFEGWLTGPPQNAVQL